MKYYIKAKPLDGKRAQRVSVDHNGNVTLTNKIMYCTFWSEETRYDAERLTKELNEVLGTDYFFTVEK